MRTEMGQKWDCWQVMGPTDAFFGPFGLGRKTRGWQALFWAGIMAIVERSRSNWLGRKTRGWHALFWAGIMAIVERSRSKYDRVAVLFAQKISLHEGDL
jgi:hypothetical protein